MVVALPIYLNFLKILFWVKNLFFILNSKACSKRKTTNAKFKRINTRKNSPNSIIPASDCDFDK